MKKVSTNFLRFTTILFGVAVLAVCAALPSIYQGGSVEFPDASHALLVITIILFATAVPFYFALWQTLKLLYYIDQNTAFSELSVKALRNIKYSAVAMAVLYLMCVPFLIPIAHADDAPGLVLFGAVFACTPLIIAVFAAVLQRLLKSAMDMKSENELTV